MKKYMYIGKSGVSPYHIPHGKILRTEEDVELDPKSFKELGSDEIRTEDKSMFGKPVTKRSKKANKEVTEEKEEKVDAPIVDTPSEN